MIIIDVAPSPITIGGKKGLTEGSRFPKGSHVDWSSEKQYIKFQSEYGGPPLTRSAHQDLHNDKYLKGPSFRKRSKGSSRGSILLLDTTTVTNRKKFNGEKKIALVVGNSLYENIDELSTPVLDADDIKDKLLELGFDVFSIFDATSYELNSALKKFSSEASTEHYDVALFYYAGHGVQNGEMSYILPVDAKTSSTKYIIGDNGKGSWISFSHIYDYMSETGCKSNLVFIDACRESIGDIDTLNQQPSHLDVKGSLVVYSTTPKEIAADITNIKEKHSPFAKAFLEAIEIPATSIDVTLDSINDMVEKQTGSNVEEGNKQRIYRFKEGNCDFIFIKQKYSKEQCLNAANKAEELIKKGYNKDAIRLCLDYLPKDSLDKTIPYVPQIEKAIRLALNNPFSIISEENKNVEYSTFSHDNKYIISSSNDNIIKVWNRNNFQFIDSFSFLSNGYAKKVRKINDKIIALGFSQITEWDFQSRQILNDLSFPNQLISGDISNDGKYIAISNFTNQDGIHLYDTRNLEKIASFGDSLYFHSLNFDNKSNNLITIADDVNIISGWNINNQTKLFSFETTDRAIKAIFSPDLKYVLAVTTKGFLIVYDIINNSIYETKVHDDLISDICFSHDGNFFVTSSYDKTIKYWHFNKGSLLYQCSFMGHTNNINSVCFDENDLNILSSSDDQTIRLWRLPQSQSLFSLNLDSRNLLFSSLSSNDRYMAFSFGKSILIHDFLTDTDKYSEKQKKITYGVKFSPNNNFIVFEPIDHNSSLSVWNNNLEYICGFKNYTNANFSLDNTKIVLSGKDFLIYDTKNWNELKRIGNFAQNRNGYIPLKAFFLHDNNSLILVSSHYEEFSLKGHCIFEKINLQNNTIEFLFDFNEHISGIALDANDHYIAFFESNNKNAHIYDLYSKTLKTNLITHDSNINHISFSNDNKYMLTASSDGSVKVWETQSFSDIFTIEDKSEIFISANFTSKDDNIIYVTKSADIRIFKWENLKDLIK